jgi:hypothetical protein
MAISVDQLASDEDTLLHERLNFPRMLRDVVRDAHNKKTGSARTNGSNVPQAFLIAVVPDGSGSSFRLFSSVS